MTLREQLYKYAQETYHTTPDHPFPRFPSYTALRHDDNRKLYCLFTDISRKKLGIPGDPEEYVDIVNLKCDPDMKMMLAGQPGILPPYHMRQGSWITVLLDGSISLEQILPLIDLSFDLTSSKTKTKNGKPHNPYWLVPANPKYYDIEGVIRDGAREFIWKQSNSSIRTGDTVYLYVAAPVSAIRFECRVLEADIPYSYADKNVSMKKAMNLQLINIFNKDAFSIETMRSHGVTTVRGPRSIPASLLYELQQYTK